MGQVGGLGGVDPSIELHRVGDAPKTAPQTGTDDDLLGGDAAFVFAGKSLKTAQNAAASRTAASEIR